MSDFSETISLFPMEGVILPGSGFRLKVIERRYFNMLSACMREEKPFGAVLLLDGAGEKSAGELAWTGTGAIARIGTTARIVDFDQLPDGFLGLKCQGERRFRILEHWSRQDGLYVASIKYLPERKTAARPPASLQWVVLTLKILREHSREPGEPRDDLPERYEDAGWAAWRLTELLGMTLKQRQTCLELDNPVQRLRYLAGLLLQALSAARRERLAEVVAELDRKGSHRRRSLSDS